MIQTIEAEAYYCTQEQINEAIAMVAAQGLSYYLRDKEGIVCRIDDPTREGKSMKYLAYKDGDQMHFEVCEDDLEPGRKVWVHDTQQQAEEANALDSAE